MERWWDGNAWTEYTRTAPVPMAGQQQAYPYPSGDVISGAPGGGGRRTGLVVVAIVAALVVIGGVVAGIMTLGGGSNDDAKKNSPTPTATLPHRSQQPNPTQTTPGDPSNPGGATGKPSTGDKTLDANDGVSLPILSGWKGIDSSPTSAANVTTGEYDCPGDPSQSCVRGGVFSQPASSLPSTTTAVSPQDAAKADIASNAKDSYGAAIYGATTSHQQIASKAVTVAGQKGYLVRWKVSTKSGTDGYVESLAFPSPTLDGQLVMVRFGFDVGGQAPGVDVMDQITQGIKADSSGGSTGGGTGTGV